MHPARASGRIVKQLQGGPPGNVGQVYHDSCSRGTIIYGLFDKFELEWFKDLEVNLENQLEPIPEEDKVNVGLYLRLIRDNHKEPRVYTPSVEAMEAFKECHKELRTIDEDSNYG